MSGRDDRLQLDARQRAMLLEMGVRVWVPLPAPARAHDAPATAAAAPSRRAAPAAARAPAAASVGGVVAAAAPAAPAAALFDAPAATGRAAAIARMDWPALQQAVSGCPACRLCETRRNAVFGVGQSAAPLDWLIVGEAPGENEDLQGEPFVGPAGQLLDNMLRALGLSREAGTAAAADAPRVFITNVLKCRPPGNRNPQPDEIAQCEPYLARQIELLEPRIILALGRFAVQTLLAPSVPDVQAQPLGRLRGRVHRWRGIPVVVSYHPAYLLRNLPEKAKAWADLVLALRVLKGDKGSPIAS